MHVNMSAHVYGDQKKPGLYFLKKAVRVVRDRSHYAALAVLELTMQTGLTLNSHKDPPAYAS